MLAALCFAFVAGFASIVYPCVLPLVPGYLSTVSAVEPERFGEPGVARRVALASAPFILGFTAVFVALGTVVAAATRILDASVRDQFAGFVLVVFGLTLAGLLPWPDRIAAPDLLQRARRRGSSALLGAAFAVCAAPCVGPVLGSALALAGNTGTVVEGAALLAAYSLGLAAAFLLAAVAFARAIAAFRWLRDRYDVLRVGGGLVLVTLGLLLFFDRLWWLQSFATRILDSIGVAPG